MGSGTNCAAEGVAFETVSETAQISSASAE